jgi:hypothetical protein
MPGEGLVFVLVKNSFVFFGDDDFVGSTIIGVSFNRTMVKFIRGAI